MNPLLNPLLSMPSITGSRDGAVHWLLITGEAALLPPDSERLMAEIELRATQMSSLLEGILHEPHGEPGWGWNE